MTKDSKKHGSAKDVVSQKKKSDHDEYVDDDIVVQEFKDTFKSEGEHLVKTVFPQKIIELEEIHKSLSLSKLSEVHSDLNIPVPEAIHLDNGNDEPATKKRKHDHSVQGTEVLALPNGPCPINKKLCDISEQLKPYIRDLIDHSNTIKMWISFLIPKIEDGNNFGVSIQEETLGEARQVESEAATYLDQISRYFISRGKLVSKVAKYPHLDDYRQSVRELDEKEYFSLRLTSAELRNHYASLHDLIMKNFEKILKPRNANAEALY
ncbi:proteasome activator complex subunit 3-like isoform X1 [Ruditapes philippinarum]|uniref:proteasome activator complex subunit 3-like isoform X1 n=1 Tax=Ruditapes philippinarum TaxID=129788 RepID=UPI00295B0173|nr:proteasome activator complex subunit 3-like isoform X1 [Ruditapes philippinarum]